MAPQGIERRLAAILAADVVGYSRLMGQDEAGTLAQLKSHRKDLFDPKIAEHRGRVVKLMGDGALVAFASVVDAVQCAVEIQRAMVQRTAEVPKDKCIQFRIGINLGDVIVDGDDIYGDGVNVAARLEGLAEPDGICISGTAFDQVRNKLDVGYGFLGEQRVKNIAEPVRAYRVLIESEAAGKILDPEKPGARWWPRAAVAAILFALVAGGSAAIWLRPWTPDVEPASPERMAFPLPQQPSIAVLPFDNLSGDPNQEAIADGFTESLITTLAQMPGLFVIARNSTFVYKSAPVKVKQVAEDLGVRYVLEGSIQRDADTLRITAQLIDALEGHHLWAGKFDRDVNAMFAVQDEIIREIFTALQVELVAGEHGRVWQKGTDNFEAYLTWLQGWKYYRRYTKDDRAIARQLFQQAIEMDPDWAMPFTTIAWTHIQDAELWDDSRAESLKLAAAAAQRALALDDTYPGVYAALGGVHEAKGEIEQAIAYHEKAVALGPNISVYHAILAYNLTDAGRADEAIPMLEKAMRLDPSYQPWYLQALGDAYNAVGRYAEAAEAHKRFVDRQPEKIWGHAGLIASYMWLGRKDEAQSHAAELLRIDPKFSLASFRKRLKYKDQAYLERLLDALRKAGLPE
ncbi:MAG: adenylate/guanylate cyclase domain-containing protein [Alphaproteobacteria bacterium]|nr:adenylate/guanylate cyclase domain-containing protein [Alphaproteobacteria bacterium]